VKHAPCGYSVSTMPTQAQTQVRTPDPNEAQRPEGQKCVTIIFNPVSGKTDPEERKKTISDALAEHGYTCQYIETSKQEGAKALAEKASKDGIDLLAVSGGDGTVMEVMSALVGKDIPVAVLPAGTGNLLSVNLGIPMTVPDAVHVALSGQQYELDLAKTDGDRYFAILGGMGLDAAMIRDAGREAKDKFGVLAYFVAALKNLPRRRSRVSLRLDGGEPISRRAKSVVIANMGKITGGLEAIPTTANWMSASSRPRRWASGCACSGTPSWAAPRTRPTSRSTRPATSSSKPPSRSRFSSTARTAGAPAS